MRGNRTLSLLRDRTPAVGAWLQLGSPAAARLLAAQGLLDWLLVDFEHAPIDPGVAAMLLGSIADVSRGRVTPLARVAVGAVETIKHALDAGAQGVIVPMVRDAAEVRRAVGLGPLPPGRRARRRQPRRAPRARRLAPGVPPPRQRGDPRRRADRDGRRAREPRRDPGRARRGPLLRRPERSAPRARPRAALLERRARVPRGGGACAPRVRGARPPARDALQGRGERAGADRGGLHLRRARQRRALPPDPLRDADSASCAASPTRDPGATSCASTERTTPLPRTVCAAGRNACC